MKTIDDAEALRHVRNLTATGAARLIRHHAGLSLREVADVVGVDTSTVWRWERDERRPRGDAALRYAALLDRMTKKGRT
jgi:transcriptional regulator with XRE-family HTH domain